MGSADALIMHEDHEESLVAIALPLFIDLILNHSQYKKPYEQIIKEKKKNIQKQEGWLLVREKSNKQKRQTLKRPNKKFSKKKYRGQGR